MTGVRIVVWGHLETIFEKLKPETSPVPRFIIKINENKVILIDGYRTYDVLLNALARLNVTRSPAVIDGEAYKNYGGRLKSYQFFFRVLCAA